VIRTDRDVIGSDEGEIDPRRLAQRAAPHY